jgi:hypothetical protein
MPALPVPPLLARANVARGKHSAGSIRLKTTRLLKRSIGPFVRTILCAEKTQTRHLPAAPASARNRERSTIRSSLVVVETRTEAAEQYERSLYPGIDDPANLGVCFPGRTGFPDSRKTLLGDDSQ